MSLEFVGVLLSVFLFEVNGAENSNLIQPFIVNGTDAQIEEFPYLVSLRHRGSHLCGGTILSELFVLTACHCIISLEVADFSVQYESTVISSTSPSTVGVQQLIRHEKFSPSDQYKNDIGLVKLKASLSIKLEGYRVKLAVLGSRFDTGTPAQLCGWGNNSTESAPMKRLQKVDLQVFSSSDCAKLHSKKIHFTNICGGVPGGYKSQCLGDSGGPLLVNGVQVGIVSWSVKPCGVPPYPGVFTGVSHYIKWIEEKTAIDLRLNIFVQSTSSAGN